MRGRGPSPGNGGLAEPWHGDGVRGTARALGVQGQGRRPLLEPARSHHTQETPVAVQTLSREAQTAGLRSSGPALMAKKEGTACSSRRGGGQAQEREVKGGGK